MPHARNASVLPLAARHVLHVSAGGMTRHAPSMSGCIEHSMRIDILCTSMHLLQVVMDLGRPPLARFPSGDVKLSTDPITQEDLDFAVRQVMMLFII